MDLTQLDTDQVTSLDPNILLRRLREQAHQTMADLDDPETAEEVTANEAGLATDLLQLDDWLSRGGFLPGAWQDTDE
jgi:hypothetical protein